MTNILLQTEAITKRYGALLVTDQVSLDVREGELHAIIGPNGAGKTTLINQLSGELQSDSGRVRFGGADVSALGINERARRGLVRSYQITSVFDEFTVRENAALAAMGARQHAFRFWNGLLSDRQALATAEESIAAAGLESRAHLLAAELGYGERRQLELAMALAARPRFLLLDEPMAGMSVQESVAVVEPAMRTFGSLVSRSRVSRQPPEHPASTRTTTGPWTGLAAPVSATAARPGRVNVCCPAAMAASKAATIAWVCSITGADSCTKRGSACIRPRVSAYH